MTGEEKYRISKRDHFVISYNQEERQLIPHHQERPTTGQRHFLTRSSENRDTWRVREEPRRESVGFQHEESPLHL